MSDLFTVINSILYTKHKVDINVEDNSFVPFLINRWGSMYSPEVCYFINETTNFRLDKIFDNKEDLYNFFINVIPKIRYKKIEYIKKKKETKQNDKQSSLIEDYANNYELSQREINEYLKMLESFENGK